MASTQRDTATTSSAPAGGWRERFLDRLLVICIGVAAFLVFVWTPFRRPPKVDVFIGILAAAGATFLALRFAARALPFRARSHATLVAMYATSVFVLSLTGFLAPGATLLLASTVVLAATLLDARAAAVYFALVVAAYIVVGALMAERILAPARLADYEPAEMSNWLRVAVTTGGITLVLAGAVAAALREVERSAAEAREALSRLQEESLRREALEAERRAAEAALTEARRLETVGRLAGGVAHDFNNALVVILGWSDLVAARARKGAPVQGKGGIEEGLQHISTAASQAAQLTRQLLAFARREVVAPRATDANGVIHATLGALGHLLTDDIRLRFVPAPGLPRILCDDGQIGRVLLNLAANARDAMPRGGTLAIETRLADPSRVPPSARDPAAPHVEIVVRDDGAGMDEATRSRIFEPFFTTKGPGRGTGLGLASVQGAVAQSGGYVIVESAPGAGTTFTIGFPAAPAEAPAGAATSGATRPPATGAGRTLLLADDDAPVREAMSSALREAGFVLLEAATGDAALELARRHKGEIELLCTDGVMPGLPTSRLIEAFRALFPRAPVLVCSGYVEEELLRRGIERGAYEFLAKPFSCDALVARVHEVLEARYAGTLESVPERSATKKAT